MLPKPLSDQFPVRVCSCPFVCNPSVNTEVICCEYTPMGVVVNTNNE